MKNFRNGLILILITAATSGFATMVPMDPQQQARICAAYPQTYFCNNDVQDKLKDKFVMGVDPKINDGRYDQLSDEELKTKGCSRAVLQDGKAHILCTGLVAESENDILKRNIERAMKNRPNYNPYFYHQNMYANMYSPYFYPSSVYQSPRTFNPNMFSGGSGYMQTLPYYGQTGGIAQGY